MNPIMRFEEATATSPVTSAASEPIELTSVGASSNSVSVTKKPISLQDKSTLEFLTILFGGSLLAFNAGYINGVCKRAPDGYSVSSVTGTLTSFGLAIAVSIYRTIAHSIL